MERFSFCIINVSIKHFLNYLKQRHDGKNNLLKKFKQSSQIATSSPSSKKYWEVYKASLSVTVVKWQTYNFAACSVTYIQIKCWINNCSIIKIAVGRFTLKYKKITNFIFTFTTYTNYLMIRNLWKNNRIFN